MPGRLPAVLLLALALLGVGCGSDDSPAGESGGALRYVPADAGLVALVSTDVEGGWADVHRAVTGGETSLEEWLRREMRGSGLDYDADVRPLLGEDVVFAAEDAAVLLGGGGRDPSWVLAWETGDAEALRRLLRAQGVEETGDVGGAETYRLPFLEMETRAALDGDVLVVAPDERRLREALERSDGDDHLTAEALAEGLAEIPADAPLRAFADAAVAADVPELRRFAGLPWVDALRTAAVALSAGENELHLDAFLGTEPEGLSEDDLPLATGGEAPEVADRSRELAGGNRDQSRTTVFLLRAVRHAFPDSRFVRHVAELEAELGFDFEEEILRQFSGPSVSVVDPSGRHFAARSEVRDPAALREAIAALAPRLPQLVEDLEALTPAGMALLFLLAPDAPVAMQELDGIVLEEPEGEDDLYRVTGLSGDGPRELHFGLVGDVFVVASTEEGARKIAGEETIEAEGAEGAAVLRVAGEQLARGTQSPLGLPASCAEIGLEQRTCEELVASVDASLDGLRIRLRLRLGGEP